MIPVIAIPSYNRVNMLKEKTLAYLKKQKVPRKIIYIFVADETEYAIYKKKLQKYNIVIGKKGIFNQRNFISEYFPENQYVVEIDDDIDDILQTLKYKGSETKSVNFLKFISRAYKKLKNHGLYLWGVNMISNPYFAYKKDSTDLRLIIGTFFGIINRKKMIQNTYKSDVGEDITRSIMYYIQDGGVLRFNDIILKTKFYNEGGIQTELSEDDRRKILKKLIAKLVRDFPNHIREMPIRKQNDIGFRLIRNPK